MFNLSKISCIFLAIQFFYLSVSASNGYFLTDNDLLAGKAKDTPILWYAEAPNLFNFTKPIKNLLKSTGNLPIFSLKEFYKDLRTIWTFAQFDFTSSVTATLSSSEFVRPQPGIRIIIFPFHFFL